MLKFFVTLLSIALTIGLMTLMWTHRDSTWLSVTLAGNSMLLIIAASVLGLILLISGIALFKPRKQEREDFKEGSAISVMRCRSRNNPMISTYQPPH